MKLLTALCVALTSITAFAADPIPDSQKINGFALGCQAYSFKNFSVFEAIEKTAFAGGKVIEFFPGQILSKEQPDVKFSHDAPPAVWEKVKAKCKEHGITPIAYGVV